MEVKENAAANTAAPPTTPSPGPWVFDGKCDRFGNREIRGQWGEVVATAQDFNCYDLDARCDANARLVAAAPDLLAAGLELLAVRQLEETEGCDGNRSAAADEAMQAAIAKAQGVAGA